MTDTVRSKYAYTYTPMISYSINHFHSGKHQPCDVLRALLDGMIQGVVLKMGYYTRFFALVAQCLDSSE